MMSIEWGSGDPKQSLAQNTQFNLAYDDHRYIKYDPSVKVSHDGYLNTSCNDNRGEDTPTVVSEFCLSPAASVESKSDWTSSNDSNKAFYQNWFAAQVGAYEKSQGWVFWAWKQQLQDYRWGYQGEQSQVPCVYIYIYAASIMLT